MQIENFEVTCGEKYLATYDIYIEKSKLTLRNFRILRSKKGGLFGVRPSFCKEIEGERKFFPLFSFGAEFDKDFDKQMQEALKPYLSGIPSN